MEGIGMSNRTDAMARLADTVQKGRWRSCSEWLYKTLYGVPALPQIELATGAMKRYLPLLERRFPGLEWPRQIIDDPRAWVTRHRCEVPDQPEMTHPADATFQFAFDAILAAAAYSDLDDVLTAGSVCAIRSATEAQAVNAWAADDPEAVAISQELNEARGTPDYGRLFKEYAPRKPSASLLANRVRTEGWSLLLSDVREGGFQSYPDLPGERLAHDFGIWKDNQMLLIGPSQTKE
jgi:hypothetical protein